MLNGQICSVNKLGSFGEDAKGGDKWVSHDLNGLIRFQSPEWAIAVQSADFQSLILLAVRMDVAGLRATHLLLVGGR